MMTNTGCRRSVKIIRRKGQFVVMVCADGHEYEYVYDSLPDAQARARRLAMILDIK